MFATSAVVSMLAFLGLVFAPVTVSVPPTTGELVALAVGLVLLLLLNLVLLSPCPGRWTSSPTRCAGTTMRDRVELTRYAIRRGLVQP